MSEEQLAKLRGALGLVRSVHTSLEGDWPSEWSALLLEADKALYDLINHPEHAYPEGCDEVRA